jgi:diadenosine tetraphosphate (Ap4A) HIT family hydrolase
VDARAASWDHLGVPATGSTSDACPFCERMAKGEILIAAPYAAALADAFPVSPGHALVVPRRHVPGYFELSEEERADVWQLVSEVKARLDGERSPAGYNVGINVGEAAGQTVWHAHVHVIPRYAGDVKDPRGGVRWVIRTHAHYPKHTW